MSMKLLDFKICGVAQYIKGSLDKCSADDVILNESFELCGATIHVTGSSDKPYHLANGDVIQHINIRFAHNELERLVLYTKSGSKLADIVLDIAADVSMEDMMRRMIMDDSQPSAESIIEGFWRHIESRRV